MLIGTDRPVRLCVLYIIGLQKYIYYILLQLCFRIFVACFVFRRNVCKDVIRDFLGCNGFCVIVFRKCFFISCSNMHFCFYQELNVVLKHKIVIVKNTKVKCGKSALPHFYRLFVQFF